MGLRDDIEDAPGKEPVRVRLTQKDEDAIAAVMKMAVAANLTVTDLMRFNNFASPVEAALHDFSLALDQAIKDHLNKVRSDD